MLKVVYLFFLGGQSKKYQVMVRRVKRDSDSPRIVYGVLTHQIQNKYTINNSQTSGGSSDSNVEVVTGNVVHNSNNVNTNIAQANTVYVVLPKWYQLKTDQLLPNYDNSRGDEISTERRQNVQKLISDLTSKSRSLEERLISFRDKCPCNGNDDEKCKEKNEKRSENILLWSVQASTWPMRLMYQQERLNQFDSQIPIVLQDTFDNDLLHSTLFINLLELDVSSLPCSNN